MLFKPQNIYSNRKFPVFSQFKLLKIITTFLMKKLEIFCRFSLLKNILLFGDIHSNQEGSCRRSQIWLIFVHDFQIPEGAVFICSNGYMQVWNVCECPASLRFQEERDGFCVPEMIVFWSKMIQSTQEQKLSLWRW